MIEKNQGVPAEMAETPCEYDKTLMEQSPNCHFTVL